MQESKIIIGIGEQRIICIILFSLFFLSVMGQDIQATVYDKWVYPDTNTSMGSYSIITTITPDWDVAGIAVNDELILIGRGGCESTLSYKVCFLDTRFNLSKKWGRFDAANDRMIPEMRITFEELIPQLTVTHTADETTVYAGDEISAKITLTMKGDRPLQNLTLIQKIPDGLRVTDTGEMFFLNGDLIWNWPTLAGEKILSYKMRADKEANLTLYANLSGSYPTGAVLAKEGKLILKVLPANNPLSIRTTLSDSQPEPGEEIVLNVVVNNSDTMKHDASSVQIMVPLDISILKWDQRLTRSGNRFFWDGTIQGKSKIEFDISLIPKKTGVHNITTELQNTFYSNQLKKDVSPLSISSIKIDTKIKPLTPEVSFMLDRKFINYSEASNVRVFVSNPNKRIILYDINASLWPNVTDKRTTTITRILPGEKIQLFYMPIKGPSVQKDAKLTASIEGTYRTEYYEKFSFKAQAATTVRKDPDFETHLLEEQERRRVEEMRLNESMKNGSSIGGSKIGANSTLNSSTTGNAEGQFDTASSTGTSSESDKRDIFTIIADWFKGLFSKG